MGTLGVESVLYMLMPEAYTDRASAGRILSISRLQRAVDYM